jgi:2',3'-cyclic-nucleotide 2'-phosphodiesterase (5'-nucleotidase family)
MLQRIAWIGGICLLVMALSVWTYAPSRATPQIVPAGTGDGAGVLSLLHNNDGESTLLPLAVTVAPNSGYTNTFTETVEVAGVAAFKAVLDRELEDARNRNQAVVNVYAGDAFLASATLQCTLDDPNGPVYDAIAQRAMPYTTHVIGNHEFDYSPDFLKRFIDAFNGQQPFLSANLDFSDEPSYASLADADGVLVAPLTDGRILGGSLVYTDTQTGQRFGIVGLTTEQLPTISTPRNVAVTVDITATATVAQAAIDHLYDDLGVRKIILVSHLQAVDNDVTLIQRLRRVDVAVAGGGDELLTNPAIDDQVELLPGDAPAVDGEDNLRPYPLTVQDGDGRTVYIVTTNGNYKYVGRLDVTFDATGEVSLIHAERSYPRRVVVANPAADAVGLTDAVAPDGGLVATVNQPLQACLEDLANTPLVRSEVLLDVSRITVRSKESNAGNLIADAFLHVYDAYADNVGLAPRSAANRLIAVANGGGIRQNAGDILPTSGVAGDPIARLDTINVLPFDNFVTVVQGVSPADLKRILERSAASLPDDGGQFLQVAGLRVVYNNVLPVGSRVISATLSDGTPMIRASVVVTGAPTIGIVTNSFTARGGDDYATLAANPNKTNLVDDHGITISYEQAWRDYLLTFPATGKPSLPTIPATDLRYQPGGEGRITVLSRSVYLPLVQQTVR